MADLMPNVPFVNATVKAVVNTTTTTAVKTQYVVPNDVSTMLLVMSMVAIVGSVLAVMFYYFIRSGGPAAWAFIRAGMGKGWRVLVLYGLDKSVGFYLGTGLKDAVRNKKVGWFSADPTTLGFAGRTPTFPIFFPFARTQNVIFTAYINWLRRQKFVGDDGQEYSVKSYSDALKHIADYKNEPLTDIDGKPLTDEKGKPVTKKALKGFKSDKLDDFEWNPIEELTTKSLQDDLKRVFTGFTVRFEDLAEWLETNDHPNHIKALESVIRAETIEELNKPNGMKWIPIAFAFLIIVMAFVILVSGAGNFLNFNN